MISYYLIVITFLWFLYLFQVAACEFLHAAVLFILGKSAQQATERKVTFVNDKEQFQFCMFVHISFSSLLESNDKTL